MKQFDRPVYSQQLLDKIHGNLNDMLDDLRRFRASTTTRYRQVNSNFTQKIGDMLMQRHKYLVPIGKQKTPTGIFDGILLNRNSPNPQ